VAQAEPSNATKLPVSFFDTRACSCHFAFGEGAGARPEGRRLRCGSFDCEKYADYLPVICWRSVSLAALARSGRKACRVSCALGETEPPGIQTERGPGLVHRSACQIVGRYAEQEFLFHHIGGFGFQQVQPGLAFERAQIGFDIPAIAIRFQNLVRGQSQGGEEIQFLPFTERIANLKVSSRPATEASAGISGLARRSSRLGAQRSFRSVPAGGAIRPYSFFARASVSRNRQGWFWRLVCQTIEKTPKFRLPSRRNRLATAGRISFVSPCSLTAPGPSIGPQQGRTASALITS